MLSPGCFTWSRVKDRELNRTVSRTVPPTISPVSIDQVIRALDLPEELDDSLKQEMLDLIGEATDLVERDTRRALLPQEWVLRLDYFPRDVIELDYPPVDAESVVVEYLVDDEFETVDDSLYVVNASAEPARVVLKAGQRWPQTDRAEGAVKVTFTAGWPNREAMPQIAQRAVLLAIKHLYEGCEFGESYHGLINRLRWEGAV
jgi:uncharacterized phiE125 gp8 family phage protein